jgi:glycine betaine/proline transport system permease protein
VAALAFAATRRAVPTLAITGCLYLVGCLGLWEQAMQTVAILSVAVALAVAIGLPVGIVSARSAWLRAGITPLLDLMQTIPSFVYLIPAAMLFGLGKVPAIVATVIYATPPLIRLTDLGLRQVDRQLTEAAKVLGANRWQVLRQVQLPLALPSIMQGVNQTTMMALGMVVIASMIGARGIGETVLLGLQRADSGQGAVGGLGIVLLAIVFDRITQGFGNRPRTKAPGI